MQQDIFEFNQHFPVPSHPGQSLRCRQRHTAEKSNEACPPLNVTILKEAMKINIVTDFRNKYCKFSTRHKNYSCDRFQK